MRAGCPGSLGASNNVEDHLSASMRNKEDPLPEEKQRLVTPKMLGDAGEHYAVSKFTFAGCPASKMPEGWTAYDLAVETGSGLARISVKTRSESERWKSAPWFIFADNLVCDWMVFLFLPKNGEIRAWVVPFDVACKHANSVAPNRKSPEARDISLSRLSKPPLVSYENNWMLKA